MRGLLSLELPAIGLVVLLDVSHFVSKAVLETTDLKLKCLDFILLVRMLAALLLKQRNEVLMLFLPKLVS